MTDLNQLDDLFITSWWEDTWVKGVADWTINPLINDVEKVGVGFSMSIAMAASSDVRDEVDKFTMAVQSLGQEAYEGTEAVINALLQYALPVFVIWYNSLNTREQGWVRLQIGIGIGAPLTEIYLKLKVKSLFKKFLLRKIGGFVEMTNAFGSLARARGLSNVFGAGRKMLETLTKDAAAEKGILGLNPARKIGTPVVVLAWIISSAQRSMVEAKRFERTFPNVRKSLQRLPGSPLSPQDWVYLYFLFADKLNILMSFAEDHLAGRPRSFVIRGV